MLYYTNQRYHTQKEACFIFNHIQSKPTIQKILLEEIKLYLFILSSEYLKLYLRMTFLQYFWFVFAAKTKSEMAANNDFSCSGLPFAQLLTNPTYFLSNRQTYLFTFLNLFLAMSLTCRTNFLPKTNLWKIFHNVITGWSGSWLVVDWRKSTTERCEYYN